MKRLAIILSIVIVLGILSPCFSILAQPTQVPHQNPATAKGSLDAAALMLSYANTFNLASLRQYQNARNILNELKHTDIPAELRYIIDRYNNLSEQLLTTLNNLEFLLDEATTLISRQNTGGAKEKLDEAEAATDDALFLLEDIEAATDTLSDKLGVFAASVTSRIKQAYNRLEESQHRLRQLINEFNQLRASITEVRKTQAAKLAPTELNLSITPPSAFIGDSVTASGKLLSGGNPLPFRELAVLFDKETLAVLTTDFDGSYETNINIPYKYFANMALTTEYIPYGDDINIYQGGTSQPVPIMHYPTFLEVSAPGTGYTGLPITIGGQVSSTNGDIDRTIKISLDDIQLAETTVREQFSLEVTLPQQPSIGEHSLSIVVAPQERYSGASVSQAINISKLPIQIDIQTPQLVIIPKPIQISGKVYHDFGPFKDAQINLSFKNSSTTIRASASGSFTTSLESPFDLSLVGPQEITIAIQTAEPWQDSIKVKRKVLIINPASTGLILVILISLGIIAYQRGKSRPQEERIAPQPQLRKLPAVVPIPHPKAKPTGSKDKILLAYARGLEAIQNISGIPMTPHATLREFLKAATPLSPTASKPFTALTELAELALYSAHRLEGSVAARAEQLAVTIEKETA